MFVTADSLSSRKAAQQGVGSRPMQTAQTAGGNGCCFLYVFCFDRRDSRFTHCSTGDRQLRPSPSKLPAEALGHGGVLSKGGRWAGWGVCLGWMEGKVSQLLSLSSGQCDADDEARAWESPLTPIMNVCSGRQCCMRWSMDTLDCDRYKLLLVLPRFADVSTSPVSLDHFTPACHPTTQSQQWARAPSCHVTFT